MTKRYPMSDAAATCARIKAAGGPNIDPAKASGTITYRGCEFGYVLADGAIAITVEQKPFVVSMSYIASKLDAFFA